MLKEEYPRPNFIRPRINVLDGEWFFADQINENFNCFDSACYDKKIIVPYVQGTEKSGVEGYSPDVWYMREFELSASELMGHILLNFGAVDFRADVFLNGNFIFSHSGGYTPFTIDISGVATEGKNILAVHCIDSLTEEGLPRGTQKDANDNGLYPPMTGIWRSVWLEFTAHSYFASIHPQADVLQKAIFLTGNIYGDIKDLLINVELSYDGKPIGNFAYPAKQNYKICIPVKEPIQYWMPMEGRLYDVKVMLRNKKHGILDMVHTYCGFRSLAVDNNRFYINGYPYFLRQVSDHCYYHESGYSVPSVVALKDYLIKVGMLGFNGIKITKCIPSPKYVYLADKLGLVLNVGFPTENAFPENSPCKPVMFSEIQTTLSAYFGCPSIAIWGLYEQFDGNPNDAYETYNFVKSIDPTRIITTSMGGKQYPTDIYDVNLQKVANYDELRHTLLVKDQADGLSDRAIKKLYTSDPLLLTPNAIHSIPEYVSSFSVGALTRYDEPPIGNSYEDQFLERFYHFATTIMATGAIGYVYDTLFDYGEKRTGLLSTNRQYKLSRKSISKLRAINKFRARCESQQ